MFRGTISPYILFSLAIGTCFGIIEWFSPISGMLNTIFTIQNSGMVYAVWVITPVMITAYVSVVTKRALIGYIAANAFLLAAIAGYYGSYIIDLLFLNTNELLSDLHYATIDWSHFTVFVVHHIGPEMMQWTAAALGLGVILGAFAAVVVTLLERVERMRAVG